MMKRWAIIVALCVTATVAQAQSFFLISKYVAGRWYIPIGPNSQAGSAGGANKIYCYWAIFPTKVTITTVGGYVTTASATRNFQLAIYSDANGQPGSLISNTGNLSAASTGAVSGNLGATIQLGPSGTNGGPQVWICSNSDNATPAYQSAASASNGFHGGYTTGSTTLAGVATNAWSRNSVSCSGANCQGGSSTFNTWPADLSTSTWTTEAVSSAAFMAFLVDSSP